MKVINFKNEPKNNPFSPEWNYFMCETQTKDINFKKLAKYLLDKEKKILKLPISKEINTQMGILKWASIAQHLDFKTLML